MARGEPQPLDARLPRDRTKQFGEARLAVAVSAVGVHVLAEQRDLDHAVGHQSAGLRHDVVESPAPFGSADVGHDAVAAAVVATHGDRQPGAPGALARRGQIAGEILGGVEDTNEACAGGPRLVQHRGKVRDVVGAEHHVDVRQGLARAPAASLCGTHPPTAMSMPGRASLADLRDATWPRSLISAFSRTAHVLKTTTSASSGRCAAVSPRASSIPAMRSESCLFIWHPKVRTK